MSTSEGQSLARLVLFLNRATPAGGQRETRLARTGPHCTFSVPFSGLPRDLLDALLFLNSSLTPARKTAPGPPRLSPPPRFHSPTRPYRKRHSRPPEKAGTPIWEISTTTCRTRVSTGCGIRGSLFRVGCFVSVVFTSIATKILPLRLGQRGSNLSSTRERPRRRSSPHGAAQRGQVS